ncbi:TonB-dependent receptor plug domain-containing protein [Croceitalea marina]|uniref:TonB-dependent receptor plug domain-containing protein n=1 Tax=Croceitalea marina TaxID=1775166 RepID=A0ABW5MUX4_9FLAO
MKKTTILVALVLINFFTGFAQKQIEIDAMVFDRFKQSPIAHAEIGIKGKDWGGIADKDGYFKIDLPSESLSEKDILVVSSLGYYNWAIPITKIEQYFSEREFILLTPIKTEKTVEANSNFNKKTILGGTTKNLYASVPLTKVLFNGSELASQVNIPYDEAIIEKVYFKVTKNLADSIQLRLNVYDIQNKLPNKSLLKNSITHWITKNEEDQIIDISDESVIAQGDIIVSLQLIEVKGDTPEIELAMSNDGSSVFSRFNGQSNWVTYPAMGMAYSVEVGYRENFPDSFATKTTTKEEVKGNYQKSLKKQASVTGKVTVNGEPVQGVRIRVKGSLDQVETNSNGEYAVNAEYGDVLETDFFTLKSKTKKVGDNAVVDFELQPRYEKLKEVVVTEKRKEDYGNEKVITPLGLKSRNSIGVTAHIKTKDELSKGAISFGQLVRGRFPALQVKGPLNQEVFSGRDGQKVRVVIDGVLINDDPPIGVPGVNSGLSVSMLVPPEIIESVMFVPGVSAASTFGAGGKDGTLFINTINNIHSVKGPKTLRNSLLNKNTYTDDAVSLSESAVVSASTENQVSGRVTSKGKPVQGVKINVQGSYDQVETNGNGEYLINADYGDILTANFFNLKPKSLQVTKEVIDFELDPKYTELKEVTVTENTLEQAGEEEIETALGKRKSRSLGFGVTTKEDRELSKSATSLGRYLSGQFPGLIVSGFIGEETYQIRGETSIEFEAPPLFVVDDIPFTTPPNFLDPNTITKATVINGLAGTNRYGSLGRGGVILIETTNKAKNGRQKEVAKNPSALVQGNSYTNDAASFKNVSLEKTIAKLGESETNITLMKTKAMFYESEGMHDKSLELYKKIANLRPDRTQSYLDMARALVKTKDYKKAFGLYKQMLSGRILGATLDADIIRTVTIEIRHLTTKHKSKVPYWELPDTFLEKALNLDTRIVFDWNVAAAPFEVQFVNPNRKFDTWSHTYEKNEERLLNETEHGYQTEQFLIEESKKGTWLVNIENKSIEEENFPIFVKCTVYRNYGSPNETATTKLVELSKLNQKVSLEKIGDQVGK